MINKAVKILATAASIMGWHATQTSDSITEISDLFSDLPQQPIKTKLFDEHRPERQFFINGRYVWATDKKTAIKIRNNQLKSSSK